MNPGRELAVALVMVLLPTVPACVYLAVVSARQRREETGESTTTGRSPATPFVLLASVSSVVALAALVAVAVTVAARVFV